VNEGDIDKVFYYLQSLKDFLSDEQKSQLVNLQHVYIHGNVDYLYQKRLKTYLGLIQPLLDQTVDSVNTSHINQEDNSRQKKDNQEVIDCDTKSLNLLDLGHCYLTNAQYQKAIGVLNEYLKQDANEALAWGYLADAYIAEKREKEAQEALKKYLSIKPSDQAYQQKLKEVTLANSLDFFAEQIVNG
jgi:predicted Zn-dependent protease